MASTTQSTDLTRFKGLSLEDLKVIGITGKVLYKSPTLELSAMNDVSDFCTSHPFNFCMI